jgi:putative addiction module component (TIGR02574 family)
MCWSVVARSFEQIITSSVRDIAHAVETEADRGWAGAKNGDSSQTGWSEGELTDTLAAVILCRMSDLAPELARLSPRQRLDLIESLWESLDDADIPLTDAQRTELDRRIEGFDQERQHSVSWDQLKAELRRRD